MFKPKTLDPVITRGASPDLSQRPTVARPTAGALTPGSPAAKALYSVWSGNPVTIVDSPPGAGKSTLIGVVVSQLVIRTGIKVVVAAPNNAQVIDIARRLVKVCPPGSVLINAKRVRPQDVPGGRFPNTAPGTFPVPANEVHVSTLSALRGVWGGGLDYDALVVDEGYQATHFAVLSAARRAKQLLIVGDPGQIGPVVTVNTTAWHGADAPHLRAPDVFAAREDAEIIHLPSTFRFGQETVDAIACLYDFPFDSAREPRRIDRLRELESIEVDDPDGHLDRHMLGVVAGRAASMVGRSLHTGANTRPLTQSDVAVVASHNSQTIRLRALLVDSGMEEITVGTADKLQGGQWEAVVALDPLAGGPSTSHSASVGRLCVMASRHKTHLTWVHDALWKDTIGADDGLEPGERRKALAVRTALTS